MSNAKLSRDRVREIFMSHGFTIKEGQTDLKEYVYEAAAALLAEAQQPQAEAVRWEVDWGSHGDRTCVSIVKKHSDGTIEVVASEYEPEANVARKAPRQAEAVPSSDLNPDEGDPVTLWAEIWRLREAVKGPDGYATWQDAATAERIRRVRAESKQAEASALIEQMADALRSCSVVPHWPSFQPLINEASKWKAEAVPPGYALVPVELNDAFVKRVSNHGVWTEQEVRNLHSDLIDAAIALEGGSK